MDGKWLAAHFGRIGARVRVHEDIGGDLRLDVRRDDDGQYFDVLTAPGANARVVDVEEKLRHLLLLGVSEGRGAGKRRFLCGHDEREWFVAAVPGESISRVRQAMEALKPAQVRFEQERKGVRGSARLRRRTAAYVRQGEWFFLPRPQVVVPERLVLRNEPLSRGRGKPHWAEFLYREGGEAVMVSSTHPRGITLERYRELTRANPEALTRDWRPMRRGATAFVKGRVRHPDHATVHLEGWHLVEMNTEWQAPGVRNVVFLD